jgi:hypothetical protein
MHNAITVNTTVMGIPEILYLLTAMFTRVHLFFEEYNDFHATPLRARMSRHYRS